MAFLVVAITITIIIIIIIIFANRLQARNFFFVLFHFILAQMLIHFDVFHNSAHNLDPKNSNKTLQLLYNLHRKRTIIIISEWGKQKTKTKILQWKQNGTEELDYFAFLLLLYILQERKLFSLTNNENLSTMMIL